MLRSLRIGNRWFEWGKRTYIVGILNITPDSFSDGGLYNRVDKALKYAESLIKAGADLLDIGGESTRPFSQPVALEEELSRVIPVIKAIREHFDIPISIDTYKAKVAQEALLAGANLVNDISALRFDPKMAEVVARYKVPIILMHMKGSPQTMQINPFYEDVIQEIKGFFLERIKLAEEAGIKRERIILDPGIGFGKRFEDNLRIISEIKAFFDLGYPVMLGPSRKSFLGQILDKPPRERDVGTMAVVALAAYKGVHLVRIHNVEMAIETIKVIQSIREVQ